MRRWAAASLLVVAALYGRETGQSWVAAGVAVILLGAVAAGPRLALSPLAARVAAAVAAAAGGALGWVLVPVAGAPLRAPWPSFALAGLLSGAVLLARREGGAAPAAALLPGLAALTACGEAPIGLAYGAFAAVHLALALLALHESAAGRAALARFPIRRAAALGGVVALAGVLTAGSVLVLPRASLWAQARILRALGGAEAGFSDRMWLGALDGMLQSDEVVMRLEGPPPADPAAAPAIGAPPADYLRGAVYDHYEVGRWGRRHPVRPAPVRLDAGPGLDPAAERVRITVVAGARDRYFLPLDARAIAAAEPDLAVDRYAVVRVTAGLARSIAFAHGPPSELTLAPPGEDDLTLPPDLLAPLERIAAAWTAGAATPEARVAAIADHLRTEFTYSLHFTRGRRRDALLDFLLDDHRGHCEYFASALTLLARAAGVPARVVVGYRVAEENPLVAGSWIVRERNAHAWSEVYLPGRGFVTVDATPAGAVEANDPHRAGLASALWDLAAVAWARAADWITLLHVTLAMVAMLAIGLAARWARRRPGAEAARARRASVARPPRALERLLDALARRGAARPAWEPLERFAARLEGEDTEAAAELLRRWAAFRYGGVGEGEALLREMEACADRLRRR